MEHAESVYGRCKAVDAKNLTLTIVRGDDPEKRASVYPTKGLSLDEQFVKLYLNQELHFVIIDGAITEVKTS